MAIEPDIKNWTWVIERACPDCGFDPSVVVFEDVPRLVRENAAQWGALLERPDVADTFAAVPDSARGRRGLRSDGSAFTLDTLAVYFLHDPVHHLNDVTSVR